MEIITRTVLALSSLIRAHHERIEAYSVLWATTSRDGIKALCDHHIELSKQFLESLSTWRSAYRGFTGNPGDKANANIWQQARLFFSLNPERTMINRCEQLELEILKMYKFVMPHIPSSAVSDLESQARTLRQMTIDLLEVSAQKQLMASLASK